MRVMSINSYDSNPQMRGYTYRPNRNPIYLNPVKLQLDRIFERSINASHRRIDDVPANLAPYLTELQINSGKVQSYAYDISKNGAQGKYILFLHGLGQNISALHKMYSEIIDKTEYSIFVPEYCGFGKNKPSEISAKTFLEDTQTALDYMINEKQIKPQEICVIGHSFGGFVASQLVKKNPGLGRLILVSSVDNLGNEIMRSSVMKHVSPFALTILKHVSFLRAYLRKLFNTREQLEKSTVPVDIIHSLNDKVVSYKSAQYLSQTCHNLQSITLLNTGGHSMEEKKIETIISLLS